MVAFCSLLKKLYFSTTRVETSIEFLKIIFLLATDTEMQPCTIKFLACFQSDFFSRNLPPQLVAIASMAGEMWFPMGVRLFQMVTCSQQNVLQNFLGVHTLLQCRPKDLCSHMSTNLLGGFQKSPILSFLCGLLKCNLKKSMIY